MNGKTQRLCAWMGITSSIIFFIGLLPLAKLDPPTPPSWDAQQVAAFFQANSFGIRLGAILMMIAISLLVPFFAVISVQLRRIEGPFAPMTYTQVISGAIGTVPVYLAICLWSVAAFRPDQPPEIILLLSDLAWISIIFSVAPPSIQLIAIGIAILGDRGAEPVFPKWLAYFCFACVVAGAPGLAVIFFKSGPFAWDGLFGFYISASVFVGVWTIVMTVQLLKAIKRQERLALAPA